MPPPRLVLRSASTGIASTHIRPTRLQSPWRLCTRCLSDSRRGAPQNPPESVRLLSEVDSKGNPLKPKPAPKKTDKFGDTFWPRTRLVLGLVFVGVLVWDMRHNPVDPDNPDDHLEPPKLAERDALAKRESGVNASSSMRLRMEDFIKAAQREIVSELEKIDGGSFRVDAWDRPEGGGGISCVLQDSTVFEKAGVNTSVVYGNLPQAAIKRMRADHKALDPNVESLPFFAAGLSLVLHPRNPMAPTVHLNYRYFETANPDGSTNAWWFGGGTDLTPNYLFPEDVRHFHGTIKAACDAHDATYYPRFKAWCDDYFRVTHRGETRGVGGIFFDDMDGADDGRSREQLFAFVRDCLGAFLPGYLPVLRRRIDMPHGEREKRWQQLRRGRYVEFNLVHDRGTAFGLSTPGARIESILMSLPLTARWQYMHDPEQGSPEAELVQVLKEPVEWV